MAFQAQQAPNYQGAASDIGQMFARKGKAHLTWAQAKRDRDERRAEMQFQKEREDQKYVRDSLMDAVKITAQAKKEKAASEKEEARYKAAIDKEEARYQGGLDYRAEQDKKKDSLNIIEMQNRLNKTRNDTLRGYRKEYADSDERLTGAMPFEEWIQKKGYTVPKEHSLKDARNAYMTGSLPEENEDVIVDPEAPQLKEPAQGQEPGPKPPAPPAQPSEQLAGSSEKAGGGEGDQLSELMETGGSATPARQGAAEQEIKGRLDEAKEAKGLLAELKDGRGLTRQEAKTVAALSRKRREKGISLLESEKQKIEALGELRQIKERRDKRVSEAQGDGGLGLDHPLEEGTSSPESEISSHAAYLTTPEEASEFQVEKQRVEAQKESEAIEAVDTTEFQLEKGRETKRGQGVEQAISAGVSRITGDNKLSSKFFKPDGSLIEEIPEDGSRFFGKGIEQFSGPKLITQAKEEATEKLEKQEAKVKKLEADAKSRKRNTEELRKLERQIKSGHVPEEKIKTIQDKIIKLKKGRLWGAEYWKDEGGGAESALNTAKQMVAELKKKRNSITGQTPIEFFMNNPDQLRRLNKDERNKILRRIQPQMQRAVMTRKGGTR